MRSTGTGREQAWHQQPCRGSGSWARNAPASGNWGQAWLLGILASQQTQRAGLGKAGAGQGRADVCSGAGEKGHRAEGGTKVAIRPPPLEPSRGHTPGSLEAPCSRSQRYTVSDLDLFRTACAGVSSTQHSTRPPPQAPPQRTKPYAFPPLPAPPRTAQRAERMGNRGHSVRGCPARLSEELLGFQFGAHPASTCDSVPASPSSLSFHFYLIQRRDASGNC